MNTKIKHRAFVRKDLLEAELSVSIGDEYYLGNKLFRYKYNKKDEFFVYYNGGWKLAQSIDFEFVALPITKKQK
jgi:hypothetical protein